VKSLRSINQAERLSADPRQYLTQINNSHAGAHQDQGSAGLFKAPYCPDGGNTMEDRIIVKNMSIAIGIIALVAIGLITLSSIISSAAGF
jgi:hypothetical protein